MMDFLGNEIHLGDMVVIAIGHGYNAGASLSVGHVVAITAKRIKAADTLNYTGTKIKEPVLISPIKAVVVGRA